MYEVSATKDEGTVVSQLEGTVTVTNGGAVATDTLKITVGVTMPPSQTVITSATVDVSGHPILAPGETWSYPYTVAIVLPTVGATYKVTADVTILNHSGHLGTPFGPSPSDTVEKWPVLTLVHDSITVTDTNGKSWSTPDSATWTYSRIFTNPADCGGVTNTATITYNDDLTTGPSASKTVTVTCIECGGCVQGSGYWKTHAGGVGNNPDEVTPHLPIWLGTSDGSKSVQVTTAAQALAILSDSGDPSNGINKLYSQLLAAKLNIANGASSSTIDTVISAADAFLATHNASDWASLSRVQKNQVLAWMTTLENYNSGLLGPTPCRDEPI